MKLGFSTGVLYKTNISPISKQALAIMRALGCNAIELGCNRPERVKFLMDIDRADLAGFEYVSLHAPAKDFFYGDNWTARGLLTAIQAAQARLGLAAVVIHPDSVTDWAVFKDYSLPIAVENMDNRKPMGQTVASLQPLFSGNDFKMVLDLNHCHINDPTMSLARELYAAFADKITHMHISGYGQDLHHPLYLTGQQDILRALPESDLPVIIESSVDDLSQLEKEYDYVRRHVAAAG